MDLLQSGIEVTQLQLVEVFVSVEVDVLGHAVLAEALGEGEAGESSPQGFSRITGSARKLDSLLFHR